jgi:hypothetical protein
MSPRDLPPIDDITAWYVDGLVLTLTPDGGASYQVDLTGWPGSQTIREEAIAAVQSLCSPDAGGRGRTPDSGWLSKSTQQRHLARVRQLLRWCEDNEIDSLAKFTPDRWDAFTQEKRAVLSKRTFGEYVLVWRSFLAASVAPGQTFLATRGRVPLHGEGPSEDHYTVAEMKAIDAIASRVLTNAKTRIQRAYKRIEEALAADEPTVAQQDIIDLWNNRIPNRERGHVLRQFSVSLGGLEPVTGPPRCAEQHFMLTPAEVTAAAALIAVRTGWNRSVIEEVGLGSLAAAVAEDESVTTVPTDKRRRKARRHSLNTLSGNSAAGRAWALVVDATEPTRRYLAHHNRPSDRLLLTAASTRKGSKKVHERVRAGLPREPQKHAVAWMPPGVTLDLPKVRRTRLTVISPAPVHNTPEVWRRDYLEGNEEYRREKAQQSAQAHERLRARAREEVEMTLLDDKAVPAEIADGSHDVATAACRDFSQHPLTGLPCQESFLDCLKCSNAVATRRHLPRLTLLHQTLQDRRGYLSEVAWATFAGHHQRLEVLLFERARLTDATYRQHLQGATPQDRLHVAEVLDGRLDV